MKLRLARGSTSYTGNRKVRRNEAAIFRAAREERQPHYKCGDYISVMFRWSLSPEFRCPLEIPSNAEALDSKPVNPAVSKDLSVEISTTGPHLDSWELDVRRAFSSSRLQSDAGCLTASSEAPACL